MENSFATNGGDGPASYSQNSKYQGTQIDQAKLLLASSIRKHLVIPQTLYSSVFRIADLGCSVGPNTFLCVQIIIEAVVSEHKAKCLTARIPEFQVFFNDQVDNDFNTLFRNLPHDRLYMAAGVPGSFHGRLFPKASVDLFNSSLALHWLAGVPDEVKSPGSLAWSKGRVTYAESSPEVAESFKAKFKENIRFFLRSRSVEMADNGMLAILMPCPPKGTVPSDSMVIKVFECLGLTLRDMAKEGLVDERLLDSFNIPVFIPTTSEVTEVVEEIDGLSIEIVKEIEVPTKLRTSQDIDMGTAHLRAVHEMSLNQHFGTEVTDALIQRLPHKLEEFAKSPAFTSMDHVENLFMLIKKVD